MNPILVTLLTFVLANIKPQDVAKVVSDLIAFLDEIMSKRGFFARQLWKAARSQMTPEAIQAEVSAIMAEITAKLH